MSRRSSAHCHCCLALAALAAGEVSGIDEPGGVSSPGLVEEILVTGTRLSRSDYFSTSPLYSVDRTEMDLAGNNEIRKLINDLPQVDPGVGGGSGNDPFGARVNLRALGDLRTLVLLNGRRFADAGIFGAPDLNALPSALVERVEVITGGASAVYGSDAIAGVVNFILRDDFDGFETSVQYDLTDHGDGDTVNIDVAYGTGFAAGRGHVALFGNYYDRSVVYEDARSFSRVPLTGDDDTGEIVSDASFVTGAGVLEGRLGTSLFTLNNDGTPRLFVDPDDRFNDSAENALLAPMQRISFSFFGHYYLSADLRTDFEFLFSRSEPEQRRADSFARFVDVNVDRPDIAPELGALLAGRYDSDGDGIASTFLLRRFTEERGPVVLKHRRDFFRAVAGVEGTLSEGWAWRADYSYSSSDLDQIISNDTSASRVQQGLLVAPVTGGCVDPSRGCVPVNPFGAGNLSTTAAAFIGLPEHETDQDVVEQIVNVSLTGSPLMLPAGALDLALGFEYRHDDISLIPSEAVLTGDSVFYGTDVRSQSRSNVREAFLEARVPLLVAAPFANYIGLEAGIRASDYSNLDDLLWTWKAGGEWQINDPLRLRLMFQRAVRAPSAVETGQDSRPLGVSFAFGPASDQCSASKDPIGNGLTDICIAQGIPADQIGVFEAGFFPTAVKLGSNPDLEAESGDTFTAGLVWTSANGSLSASIDYFDIEIDNASVLMFPDEAIRVCFTTRDIDDPFCSLFNRGPGNNIESAMISFVNAALITSEGLDVSLNLGIAADRLALFGDSAGIDLSVIATRYLSATAQSSPLAPAFDCAGKFGALCNAFPYQGALPEFRLNARLTYRTGPLAVSLRWRHTGSMDSAEDEHRAAVGQPPPMLAVSEVGSRDYFDLSLNLDSGDRMSLRFGIENLFDRDPPFLGSGNQAANTDPKTYDTLGRRYYLRLTGRL